MADLSWLRHFGQRPRTPTPSGSAPDEPDYFSSPSMSTLSPSRRLRGQAVRRVSSLLSLVPSEHSASTSLPTPTIASFKTAHSDAGSFKSIPDEHNVNLDGPLSGTTAVRRKDPEVFLREADRIWHAPSIDQMIESLQVAMMNKPSSLEPLPIQYNGHVLALIEGYAKIKRELESVKQAAAAEVEKVNKMRQRELNSYDDVSDEWIAERNGYRAEIKRLELMLAHNTEGGMATVALARAGSVVDRGAKARKRFEERVKRLSRGEDGDGLEITPVKAKPKSSPPKRKISIYKHVGSDPMDTDPDHDRRISQQFRLKDAQRHLRFAKKHRRPSRGNQPASERDAAARAQGPGTYVPTGVPPSDGRDDSPYRLRGYRQRDRSAQPREIVDSSSSSFNVSSASTSSSEGIEPVSKGKEVDHGGEVSDRDIRWNTEVTPNLTAGAGIVPTQHGNRTMGELAIERFLKDGTVVQGPIEGDDATDPITRPLDVIAEDYFTQPRARDQRRRARGFSFMAGDDDSLHLSPMALPSPAHPNGEESAEVVRQRSSQDNEITQFLAAPAIRQPRPRSTLSHSRGASVARQLQETVDADGPSIVPTVTTPAQALGTLFVPTAVTTPSSSETKPRPTSTGSVVYMGDGPSAAGSRDSTGSRVTVLRDNSGRASRRQSSQSQATSDLSFESVESKASPAMSPIPERRSLNPISPTPSARGGKKKTNRRSRGGASSTTSSPALAPLGTDAALVSRVPTPLMRPSSPATSSNPTPPRRAPSSTGGSEASVTAGQAARIAATLAVARGQKRRESEHQ
ncbi:hypothetical protein CONLIGDRAFT_335677 [Coniochaeta ligniaria NRRL 30616]|uniref:Uncharacterized protein n=1 Tax=Coniochaeta ligniaria NRRL 30616 TaxID=1408157 RepID=A0A1J7IQZ7_9PEZI|nr:hypothetical protein CONLIGDRAFT_335677 [Coniochaeta ligniaria NRRL 30616]